MKDNIKKYSLICNAVLVAVIIMIRSCSPSGINTKPVFAKADTTVHIKKETQVQLQNSIVKVYVPEYTTKYVRGKDNIIESHDTVYLSRLPLTNKDSLEAIANYFIATVHLDTLVGSQCKAWVKDSISKNKLLGRTYGIVNSRRTVENILNPQKGKIFIGANLGLSLNLKTAMVAPNITWITKNDGFYQVSYDFVNSMPCFGMAWKIKLK